MALKGLFVAINASNGFIKTLFLPIWYTLLLSPFILSVAYWYGLGQTLQDFVGEDFSWFDILPQFAISAVFILLPTRLLSGSKGTSKNKDGGKSRVQSLPYWIPGIQHLGNIVSGQQEWLKGVKDASVHSIVSYKAAGARHVVLLTSALLEEFHRKCNDLPEHEASRWAILRNAFGMPKTYEHEYLGLQPTISKAVSKEILGSQSMEALVAESCRILTETLPDLITFNSSIVDQMQWERVASVELTDGSSEVECDFFTLINDFVCNTVLGPITGTQFPESYQLLGSDLADFNKHFYALSLGIPRLSPIQGLPTAALAKKRLSVNFDRLFTELTHPKVRRAPADDDESMSEEETDADTTTPLAALNQLFTKHDVPVLARASLALNLIHSIVAEVIAQDDQATPFAKIKEETKSWARAIQPPSIHPLFPAPPEISFTSSAESHNMAAFPHLRSCISEARRLYGSSATMHTISNPTSLDEKSLSPGAQESWELEAGSHIDLGLSRSLINSSSSEFPSPETFKPDRFIDAVPGPSITSPSDTSAPYKTALLVSIIAGIIQLWDITPAPKKTFMEKMIEVRDEVHAGAASMADEGKASKGNSRVSKEGEERKTGVWVLPKAVDAASVKVPNGDIRVRIRRREDLPAPKVPRKR